MPHCGISHFIATNFSGRGKSYEFKVRSTLIWIKEFVPHRRFDFFNDLRIYPIEYFLKFPANKKYGYTIKRKQKTENNKSLFIVHCSLFSSTSEGISFIVKNIRFNLKLLGEFNIYNALASICIALSQGIDLETCRKALERIKGIPGRMELVISDPFKVLIDYAFTPNALAVASVAARLTLEDIIIQKAIIVLGAVAPTPLLASKASQSLIGNKPSEELFKEAASSAQEESRPISDLRGSIWFREALIDILTRRALEEAFQRARKTPQGEQ